MAAQHHDVTEHKIGTMDTTEQEKTFAGFIKFAGWSAFVSILILVVVALANS